MLKTWGQYNTEAFNTDSDALYDSDYATNTLVFELADAISIKTDHPIRVKFLSERDNDPYAWCRGIICKALVDLGVILSDINRRRA